MFFKELLRKVLLQEAVNERLKMQLTGDFLGLLQSHGVQSRMHNADLDWASNLAGLLYNMNQIRQSTLMKL